MKSAEIRFLKEEEFDKWDEFVEASPQGSIFSKSFWLKAVSNEFKILVCEENGKIIGGITLTSIYNKFYRNPKLTPRLGVILAPSDKKIKYSTIISKHMEIVEELLHHLPEFKQFEYTFSHNFSVFMPFIWKGFKVGVKYTYIIDDLLDIDKVYDGFQYDIKYTIKRAIKNNITIVEDYTLKDFYEINKKSFLRQGLDMPYSYEFLSKMDKALEERNSRKILFAKSQTGELIAAAYLIYDSNCTYYLMGGADPEQRNTGAQKLLIWEGIKFASKVSKAFDFEGSMIPNIEKSFREFGGKQTITHNVYKSDTLTEVFYNLARKNRELVRKIFKV